MPVLTCRKGDSYSQVFRVYFSGAPMDLGTVTLARFSIKTDPEEDLDSEALIRLSTGVGGVAILTQTGATKGQLRVTMTPAETLPLPVGRAYWDLQLTLNDGSVYTPISGEVIVDGHVTINSADVGTDT